MKKVASTPKHVPAGPEERPAHPMSPEIPGKNIPDSPILPHEKPQQIPQENPSTDFPPSEFPEPADTSYRH